MMFLFGFRGEGGEAITALEWVSFGLFPGASSATFLLRLRFPLLGTAIALGCVAASALIQFVVYKYDTWLMFYALLTAGPLAVFIALSLLLPPRDSNRIAQGR
jgi:hypothetical protein